MAQELWYKDATGPHKFNIAKSALESSVQTSLGKADTALQSHQDISGKANTSDLGTAAYKNTGTSSGNVPVLDSNGKLNSSVLPAIAITDTNVVNSQASMLALAAEVGDVCVRTDLNKSFILKESGASTLSHWQELLTPTDAVTSVNGQTGAVTITAASLGALTSHQSLASCAKIGQANNLLTAGNEFNFIPDNFNGSVWINYESISRDNSANVTEYILGNGKGSSLGTIIHSGNIGSQSVNYASSAGAVAWANVSGKPSTYTPSSHNHNDLYVRYDTASQGLNSTQQSNARANIGAGTSNFSGNYNDLSNKPTIPTNTNQLTNGAGFITSSGSCQHAGNATNATHALEADVVNDLYVHHIYYKVESGGYGIVFTTALLSADNTPMTSLDDIADYMRDHTIGANPLSHISASIVFYDDNNYEWVGGSSHSIWYANDELWIEDSVRILANGSSYAYGGYCDYDSIPIPTSGYYFTDEVSTYN